MNCLVCEAKLPPLEALLAETQVGTQCPKCWTLLRELKQPVLRFPASKAAQKAAPRRRRAA
jgi:hypothetical protein